MMISINKKKINRFDQDVTSYGGYLYTIELSKKSSKLANKRLTEITKLMTREIRGKKVIDIGCGDGTYTYELYRWGKPKIMVGIDISREAINLARKKFGRRKNGLVFKHCSCYEIPYAKGEFDIAIVRGLLHHLDNPAGGLSKIVEITERVLVIEPNGYNPLLKLIEKISPYHRQHGEKSYFPRTMRTLIKNLNRKVIKETYVGLVPFFCPDWAAGLLKKSEPLLERTPILRNFFCGVYVILLAR